MSETLLNEVQEMLKEKTWTRATLNNYSIDYFKKLDKVLEKTREERAEEEIKNLCDEFLKHTKDSIIALYLSGMIALSRQIIDDGAMVSLVTLFDNNHKKDIVKHLCGRMLDLGESKFALRTLAECYKNDEAEKDKLYETYKKLVRVDAEEADLAKVVAEHYEKLGDYEEALEFYKKALHRFINKQLFINIHEIWKKLLELCPEDIDFFLHVQKKIAKNLSEDKAVLLLQDVYKVYRERDRTRRAAQGGDAAEGAPGTGAARKGGKDSKKRKDLDTAIGILKLILDYDEKDIQARREITECFREKYAQHSQLEEYIRVSNLAQHWRNVHEAITDFEKHIAFDKGNWVFHNTWGVGYIANVEGDEIRIDFVKKRGHVMSLKMAVNALQTLPRDHIWVLKVHWNPKKWKKESLHDMVKEDPVWALKTVIKSFDNACDFKRIKAELSPAVLTPGEWASWSDEARKKLKTDPSFGISPENPDLYIVREGNISMHEKLYNEFKAQRDFFDRAGTLRSFAANRELEEDAAGRDGDQDSEYFSEMLAYFNSYLKPGAEVNEYVVASYLLLKEIAARFPGMGAGLPVNFQEIFDGIEDPALIYEDLKDSKLKEDFIRHIQLFVPGWKDIFLKLFPREPLEAIISALEQEGEGDKLSALVSTCFENYRDCKEAVFWLMRNKRDAEWYKNAGLSYEKQLISLIHILDTSYREIENRRNTAKNKKINKLVHDALFKDGLPDPDSKTEQEKGGGKKKKDGEKREPLIAGFIDGADQGTVLRLYTFIHDVKDLDPVEKMALRDKIALKFPDIKFPGDTEKKVSRGLIVTLAMYEEKQKQLARINGEEIPANAKEIEFALSLGDLSENAEYKAAKEKQTILNSTLIKLQGEIDRAQIFDPSTVNTKKVSFGTRVTLLNTGTGKREQYTILGPWESDPKNGIISYLSPFGEAILDKAIGDKAEFKSDKDLVSYSVEMIVAAL